MKKTFGIIVLCIAALLMLAGCRERAKTNSEGDMVLFGTVCTADEGLALAKQAGWPTAEDGRCTANEQAMEEFYYKTQKGEAEAVYIAQYYTLDRERTDPELYEQEKDNYPMLFLSKLEYDGSGYQVAVRLSTETEYDTRERAPYLMHYTGRTPSVNARYTNYEHYVLVNDDTVTWEQIEHGMLSADFRDQIPHHTVFTSFFNETEPTAIGELFKKVCTADEGLALAKEAGAVVTEQFRCTANKAAMEEFYGRTREGEAASVLVADYIILDEERVSAELYEQEKDNYPMLLFYYVEYTPTPEGGEYSVSMRESSGASAEYKKTFKYLMHYKGDAPVDSAGYKEYDRYVLVNDDTLTWKDVELGMVSSSSLNVINSCIVFTEFVD